MFVFPPPPFPHCSRVRGRGQWKNAFGPVTRLASITHQGGKVEKQREKEKREGKKKKREMKRGTGLKEKRDREK